ncbi:hypothetical protein T439DRAFT_377269 [Meredithblackwellia eburnea MCA 4105]
MAGSTSSSILLAPVFILLSVTAYYLLFVVGEQNGFLAINAARCKAGLVRTTYTGFPQFDSKLCILVSVLNLESSNPVGEAWLNMFSGIFSAALVIINLEALRPGNPAIIRYSPLITGLAGQLLGAAVAVPAWMALYCFAGLGTSPGSASSAKALVGQVRGIRAFFPTFFGFFFIAAFLMNNKDRLSPSTAQFCGGIWQAFPLLVAIVQPVVALLQPPKPGGVRGQQDVVEEEQRLLRFFTILTTFVYWGGLYRLYLHSEATSTPIVDVLRSVFTQTTSIIPTFERVALPDPFFASHTFLFYDGLVTLVALYTFILSFSGGGFDRAIQLAFLTPIIGPGASSFWIWRGRDSGKLDKGKKRA